jgi:3-hydroxyisobutyrate dehydrogenase-like beta-hydroxyacid dehydrogenase
MKPVVALIAPGNMGAAVGKRLTENGVQVLTSLAGRSDESVARAHAAGMTDASHDQIAAADLILSIVPPGDALSLAEKLAPALERGNRKPAYVDCNAVNPKTVAGIEAAIAPTACPFVDAGILGGPPKPGSPGPAFYASGTEAPRFAVLNDYGLDVRVLDGGVGAASAMKMSYAGITKGFTALGTVMMLAASRAGTADVLHRELAATQPQLLAWLTRQVPNMYSKAYRWVAEMEEIAGFVGEDEAGNQIFSGAANLYDRIADDFDAARAETGALTKFLDQGKKQTPPSS